MKQPPQAALALLQVFLPAEEFETIAGDLVEEFAAGKSVSWFWTQVLRSLSDLAWMGMRRTPLLTIGAMLGGYFAMACGIIGLFGLLHVTGGERSMSLLLTAEFTGGFLCAILGGYLAAWISRGSGANGIIALSGFSSLMALASLGTEPLWKELALMAVFVPGILVGGFLRARSRAIRRAR